MKDQKKIAFAFEEVPLEEAKNSVIAGDGNYADLKAKLLTVIPEIHARNEKLSPKDQKAFAFGNGKELPEDQRRGICIALCTTLKRADIPWRVTYSSVQKLFICIPTTRKTYTRNGTIEPKASRRIITKEMVEKIKQLRREGKTGKAIAALLNLSESTVSRFVRGIK